VEEETRVQRGARSGGVVEKDAGSEQHDFNAIKRSPRCKKPRRKAMQLIRKYFADKTLVRSERSGRWV